MVSQMARGCFGGKICAALIVFLGFAAFALPAHAYADTLRVGKAGVTAFSFVPIPATSAPKIGIFQK